MLVGTTTATTMAFAFAIFGKKRRDEEAPAPDEVLQAQAARGHAAVPGGEVVGAVAAAVPPPVDVEAGMPRWRRPSVQAARKSDPTRYVESARMSFDHGSVDAVDGHERRVIRYRVVRLLDAPDELRGIGYRPARPGRRGPAPRAIRRLLAGRSARTVGRDGCTR